MEHQKLSPREKWLLNHVAGKKILNIGFVGKGIRGKYLHNCLKKNNQESFLVAIDINIKKLISLQVNDSLAGDISHLPFKNGVFDGVVVGEIIEHFYGIHDIFNEIRRICKTNGIIYLTTPNVYGIFRFLKHWLFTTDDRRISVENINGYHGDPDHKIFWEPLSLSKLLQNTGFEVIESRSSHLKIPYLPLELNLQFWPFNTLSDTICIIARRK